MWPRCCHEFAALPGRRAGLRKALREAVSLGKEEAQEKDICRLYSVGTAISRGSYAFSP